MYKPSSFNQISAVVFSFETCRSTLSLRLKIVMRGVRKHGLYSLEEEIVDGSVASISVRDMSRTELWHRRLGIARHKSIARTPQQNGLAERFNKTILERVRCMLSSAAVLKTF